MPSSSKSEVERKFLALDVPDGLTGPSGVSIDQGYLAIDEESEVRLRRAGDRFTLTVKNGHGESRRETEVDLDQALLLVAADEAFVQRVGVGLAQPLGKREDLVDGVGQVGVPAGRIVEPDGVVAGRRRHIVALHQAEGVARMSLDRFFARGGGRRIRHGQG